MNEAVITAVLVMLSLNVVILYAALVVAGECDDRMEEYWRNRNEGHE